MPSLRRPQTPADPAGAGRPWRRGLAFGLLACAVLALHGWLLRAPVPGWGRPLVRPGPRMDGRAPPMQVVDLAAAGTTAPMAPLPVPAGAARPTPAAPAGPEPAAAADRPARAPPPGPRAGSAPPARQAAGTESASPAPLPGAARPASADAPWDAGGPVERAERGHAPPVYPTRLPPALSLHYRAERGGASGTAELEWAPGAQAYQLRLRVELTTGSPIDWRSQGGFDRDGLAPMRMVERQKQRDRHAVNFQRDKGVISFAGPSEVVPFWRGAQDRLSAFIQLAAVVRAWSGPVPVGTQVRLQVAMPRGDVDEWVFTLEGTDPVDLAGQRWAPQRWVREPARPYDQRVEVWLAPAAGDLPVGLRWTTVPGGEPLSLWLAELPPVER